MWILVAMIAVMPFEKSPYLLISESFLGIFPYFTVIKLLGLIGLGWAVMQMMSGRIELRLFESAQAKAFSLFVFVIIVAGIASGAGLRAVTKLLAVVLFFPLTLVAVRTEAHLRTAIKAAVLTMIVLLPYGYRQMLRFGGRFGIALYEPNYMALALVLLAPLPFIFARQETVRWKKLFWWGGLGVVALEVILTGSRGGFLGLLLVLGLVAMTLARRRALALAAIGGVLVTVLVFTTLGERLRASGADEGNIAAQGGIRTRLEMAAAGLDMIRQHPLTGVGFGNFKVSTWEYETSKHKIAHNTYIEVAAELGLPALLIFLGLLYSTFASLHHTKRLARSIGREDLAQLATAMQAGFAGWMVSATFLSATFENFFWLMLFLSIGFASVVRELVKKSAPAAIPQASQRLTAPAAR
jgi:O-antigen ligase